MYELRFNLYINKMDHQKNYKCKLVIHTTIILLLYLKQYKYIMFD